ncbi:hypothetical protein EDI_016330 [Entamoeba dispar SAW760]|uniref:Transmembrane protein n=1 Tax=Entamoeba dispar (strain ATCC PRA-260 / SAW760) TaxID=370354 RepID=B0ENM4_ENTDS|nr:uncharacterized protein EDI_016330 [Entamoeba dispar SAW760]EDR23851.1 hypothetical protein EDI_016330 [Entamoeba dispar SAW760]|eukprot:EDR23851.1 hypothetical protein EDI_016330 [Entamoeba dispar SAW760]
MTSNNNYTRLNDKPLPPLPMNQIEMYEAPPIVNEQQNNIPIPTDGVFVSEKSCIEKYLPLALFIAGFFIPVCWLVNICLCCCKFKTGSLFPILSVIMLLVYTLISIISLIGTIKAIIYLTSALENKDNGSLWDFLLALLKFI